MQKRELIWTFEQFNRHGAFDRTLGALRKNNLSAAAQFARLDHARLLGAVREGRRDSKLSEGKLPPFYLSEVKTAITALDQHIKAPDPEVKPAAKATTRKKPKTLSPLEKKVAREAALERAQYRCEHCGLPYHAVGYRTEQGEFVACQGDDLKDFAGKGLSWPSGERLTKAEARELTELLNTTRRRQTKCDARGRHWQVVDLAAIHIDSNDSNFDSENLIILCRRCWSARKDKEHERS